MSFPDSPLEASPGLSVRIAPCSARAFRLPTGMRVRIIDEAGGQPGDLVAFDAGDPRERFSQARTRVENGVYRLTRGHALWSNAVPPRILLTVTGDTAGGHDLLYTPCNRYALAKRFGVEGEGCQEHLAAVLAPWGIRVEEVPDPLNLFFPVTADPEGTIRVEAATGAAGQWIELRAERECRVAVSTCAVPRPGRLNSGYTLEFEG